MAQMESKWIDNRSFEQITLETIPTGKYNDIFKMIKENPKPFSTEFILTDDEMSSARKEIANLKKTIENLNVTIEKIKNPKKNIPRSLFLGTLIVTIVYLLANLAYLALIPLKLWNRNLSFFKLNESIQQKNGFHSIV